jgi:signal transduction histidine kinase
MRKKLPSILVIEDTPATLSVLFNLLDDAGFEVLVALNGEKALNVAKEGRPDLILLDVLLAGIDGFEICRRLKASEATCEIPIIFMTALTKTDDKIKGFELGAVDYITKPFEPEEVLMRIKTHLTIQQLQQDLQDKNEELYAALERERELNQLKSRFISIASHEFRTPLSAILFSKDLLKRYYQKTCQSAEPTVADDVHEQLDSITRAVKQMTATLDEVLTITKSEAGKVSFSPTLTNITALCRETVEKWDAMSTAVHTVIFSNPGEPIQALIDPKLFETIVSNLLSNAIKYSPQGGEVRCDLTLEAETIRFAVQDQGIGIAEEDQRHLFEAFHRGINAMKIQGTGLGLSIVKQFVELHEGTIIVESKVQKGSAFTVCLPYRV